jgi:hypothetical protein
MDTVGKREKRETNHPSTTSVYPAFLVTLLVTGNIGGGGGGVNDDDRENSQFEITENSLFY